MVGGYYRVDLTDELSVLSLNTLYYDSKRNAPKIEVGDEGATELEWLEQQLSEKTDRKFILISHVYAGTRYKDFVMWEDTPSKKYFEILRDYKDRVIIELAGHDHFTAMRYHSSHGVFDLPDPEQKFNFHNLLIAPSVTPWYRNNPGVSVFELSDAFVPQNLRTTYLNLEPTMNVTERTPYEQLEFRSIDYEVDFGIKELTPYAFETLAQRFKRDANLHKEFMVRSVGMHPSDPKEVLRAYEIFIERGLGIQLSKEDPNDVSLWPHICTMTSNISVDEFALCAA